VCTSMLTFDFFPGSDHLVILTESGSIFTCGCPEQGQLGRVGPRNATRERRSGFGDFLVPVRLNLKKKFNQVWASYYGTYAKTVDGLVYRCGLNNYFQLGMYNIQLCVYSARALDGSAYEFLKERVQFTREIALSYCNIVFLFI